MGVSDDDTDTIRRQFEDAVNMSSRELEDWPATEESQSVGQSSGDGDESTGHAMDRISKWRYSLMNWGHDPLR